MNWARRRLNNSSKTFLERRMIFRKFAHEDLICKCVLEQNFSGDHTLIKHQSVCRCKQIEDSANLMMTGIGSPRKRSQTIIDWTRCQEGRQCWWLCMRQFRIYLGAAQANACLQYPQGAASGIVKNYSTVWSFSSVSHTITKSMSNNTAVRFSAGALICSIARCGVREWLYWLTYSLDFRFISRTIHFQIIFFNLFSCVHLVSWDLASTKNYIPYTDMARQKKSLYEWNLEWIWLNISGESI